jgi:hypothetical protein
MTGAGGTGGPLAQCGTGIRNDITTCSESCTDAVCGLGDYGSRDCVCLSGVYSCASCRFPDGVAVLEEPSTPLPACSGSAYDGAYCGTLNERCMSGGEVCLCLYDALYLVWDCDAPPWNSVPCPDVAPAGSCDPAVDTSRCSYGRSICQCETSEWICQPGT